MKITFGVAIWLYEFINLLRIIKFISLIFNILTPILWSWNMIVFVVLSFLFSLSRNFLFFFFFYVFMRNFTATTPDLHKISSSDKFYFSLFDGIEIVKFSAFVGSADHCFYTVNRILHNFRISSKCCRNILLCSCTRTVFYIVLYSADYISIYGI